MQPKRGGGYFLRLYFISNSIRFLISSSVKSCLFSSELWSSSLTELILTFDDNFFCVPMRINATDGRKKANVPQLSLFLFCLLAILATQDVIIILKTNIAIEEKAEN
jgi:hypothetical protein